MTATKEKPVGNTLEGFLASKLPISDQAAEKGYIGSALWDPRILDESPVKAEVFYLDLHQKIVSLLQKKRNAGEPIDAVSLMAELKTLGDDGDHWERILVECIETAQHPGNAAWYARLVHERYTRRVGVQTGGDFIRDLYEQPDSQAVFARHSEALAKLMESGEADDAMDCNSGLISVLESWMKPGAVGMPTGYFDLDRLIGGWQSQRLYLLAANTGIGKTALAINFAAEMSKHKPVLFISLEMPATEVFSRFASCVLRQSTDTMQGTVYAEQSTAEYLDAFSELGHKRMFRVDDRGGRTIASIAAQARKHHRRKPLGLLIVDYVGLIEPADKRIARHEQIGSISRGLKLLAKNLNIPVLGLSQLSRQASGEGVRPQLHHLRESGSLEQDSDVVLFIHRDRDKSETTLIVEKNRSGKIGEVQLTWNNDIVRFDSSAWKSAEQYDPMKEHWEN